MKVMKGLVGTVLPYSHPWKAELGSEQGYGDGLEPQSAPCARSGHVYPLPLYYYFSTKKSGIFNFKLLTKTMFQTESS